MQLIGLKDFQEIFSYTLELNWIHSAKVKIPCTFKAFLEAIFQGKNLGHFWASISNDH